jgi:hypothetical protein
MSKKRERHDGGGGGGGDDGKNIRAANYPNLQMQNPAFLFT